MHWRNDARGYGAVVVALHWIVAVMVVALFGLGFYMRSLSYYDPLYRILPQWHKDIGLILTTLAMLRLGWRFGDIQPAAEPHHRPWERSGARFMHVALYLLPFAMMASGYLISTADGRTMSLWDGTVEIPALLNSVDNLEDRAGFMHKWLAFGFIGLAALHAAAAIKHHFIDRDRTLRRMLGR